MNTGAKKGVRLISAGEAAALVQDGVTIATGGFCGAAHPEALGAAIERRFLAGDGPRDLTLVYGAGQGDAKDRGLNHFGHEGLVKRVVGGHWRLAPKLGKLAMAGKIEAVNLPQGVMCLLFRDIAGGRPGCITHVGLGTFIDPAYESGCLNDRSPRDLVERVELGGKTYLWYKAFPIHVAFIRGTSVDPEGSITVEEEGMKGEALALAQAAHNSGGIVIAQVLKQRDTRADPHSVTVPGTLVDYVVLADPAEHMQTFANPHDPELYAPAPMGTNPAHEPEPPLPMSERRIIGARACDELQPGDIANLGIGMPEEIARIADERGQLSHYTLTVEAGVFGGRPSGGLAFGTARHPIAIIDQPAMFDFYDGGGLDFAALGAAQIDGSGAVNVSCFAGVVAGVGGFVNITQNAKRLVFCGTLTAGGLKVEVVDSKLVIVNEGKHRKFVEQVDQVSFNARLAQLRGQQVRYVTERAVFDLTDDGLELIEVAPGIDVHTQVIEQMGFEPIVRDVREMPAHVFAM